MLDRKHDDLVLQRQRSRRTERESARNSREVLRGRKRSLYEGGIRVPGLLVWPEQIKSRRIVSMPCVTSDYYARPVLDYCWI